MERSTHFQWENPLFQWPFSIAMLNYQMVTIMLTTIHEITWDILWDMRIILMGHFPWTILLT